VSGLSAMERLGGAFLFPAMAPSWRSAHCMATSACTLTIQPCHRVVRGPKLGSTSALKTLNRARASTFLATASLWRLEFLCTEAATGRSLCTAVPAAAARLGPSLETYTVLERIGCTARITGGFRDTRVRPSRFQIQVTCSPQGRHGMRAATAVRAYTVSIERRARGLC
jgi:hypothetical protein